MGGSSVTSRGRCGEVAGIAAPGRSITGPPRTLTRSVELSDRVSRLSISARPGPLKRVSRHPMPWGQPMRTTFLALLRLIH